MTQATPATAGTNAVMYNPFEPGFAADPYPQYAMLRERDPVHQTPFGVTIVFGYDDVQAVLRSRHVSVDESKGSSPFDQLVADGLGEAAALRSPAMLNRDAPDHTRLRRLVSKAFTPNAIAALRPRIQQLVDAALDAAEGNGEFDVIGGLAFPLPFAVISEMLGMPDGDRDQLREWSGLLVRTLEPIPDMELLPRIVAAGEAMRDHVRGVIEAKRTAPADDLLTALIAAEDNGDVLSIEELSSQVGLLFIAGHETTVNLIGNGVLALLRNPDQLAQLRDDTTVDENAIEELLRYDPPVQMSRRITLADLEVGGCTIEAGRFVGLGLASANRDRSHFGDDADELDLSRPNANEHISFGGGIHHCLGAALARIEGQIAITTFVRRFPDMALAGEPVWNGRINLRGMERLPVTLGKGGKETFPPLDPPI